MIRVFNVFVYGKKTYIGSNGTSLYLRGTIGDYAIFANATGIKINNKSGTAEPVLYLSSANAICLINTSLEEVACINIEFNIFCHDFLKIKVESVKGNVDS